MVKFLASLVLSRLDFKIDLQRTDPDDVHDALLAILNPLSLVLQRDCHTCGTNGKEIDVHWLVCTEKERRQVLEAASRWAQEEGWTAESLLATDHDHENPSELRRLLREQRLAALGFEEPAQEQCKANLALNMALREWPKE
jgi:hypothetical protein